MRGCKPGRSSAMTGGSEDPHAPPAIQADGLPVGTAWGRCRRTSANNWHNNRRGFADPEPPVVGGAPWCLRGRSEYQLKFAKRSQNSRAGIYCGTHYSCRRPHDPTHSRRHAADSKQGRRNRPCLQGIARQPPLQQFVFRTGQQHRAISRTGRKAVQSRHRGKTAETQPAPSSTTAAFPTNNSIIARAAADCRRCGA